MWRGEIRLVDFEPVTGSEANKVRPAVIVSNDGANAATSSTSRGVVTVVPLTTNTARVLSFQVLLPSARCGVRHDSKAQPEQIRAVAASRVGALVGTVPPDLMAALDAALRLHLGL